MWPTLSRRRSPEAHSCPPPVSPPPDPKLDHNLDRLELMTGIVDGITEMIAALDERCRYLACNRAYREAFARFFGATVEIGSSIEEVLSDLPDERANTLACCRRALAGQQFTVVAEVRRQPADLRTYEFRYGPLRNSDHRIVGVTQVAHDITDLVAANKALRESEIRFRRVVEHIRDALMVDDAAGKVVFANDRFFEMFGFDRAEIGQLVLEDYVAPEYRQELRLRHDRRIRGEAEPTTYSYEGIRRDGARMWLEVDVVPIMDEQGRVTHTQSAIRDIGERRRVEKALRDADRSKDDFIAVLSHELRNPLAPIQYALPLLQRELLTSRARRAVEVIQRQVHQLGRLVDDLLDMSRIRRDKIELRLERVSVEGILTAATEAASPAVAGGCHRLEVTIPEEPIWLDADAARMAQVVTNLLINSAKYTPQGGEIALEAQREDGLAVIRVRDNGIGIPTEALPRVFEMFRQIDRPGQPRGGLGIGLGLAKRLVVMHRGTIEARSAGIGRGAEFIVRLPVAGED